MTEGYCDKCKTTREMFAPVEVQLKNGRRSIRGRCPVCGASLLKMVANCELDAAAEAEKSPKTLTHSTC